MQKLSKFNDNFGQKCSEKCHSFHILSHLGDGNFSMDQPLNTFKRPTTFIITNFILIFDCLNTNDLRTDVCTQICTHIHPKTDGHTLDRTTTSYFHKHKKEKHQSQRISSVSFARQRQPDR